MNVIQLKDEWVRIECTLFGEYVDKLNASLLLEKVTRTLHLLPT
ncbi:hypothetical protein glysoja_043857 [Glycine soja]|uniref:Uncharacterized protein n=1 Tax=Glycine soja TaxID=3848 RepID=A0A0B2QUV4_GLYSO|nr:hypothetical protein glysoja_043857 [Glycine soja]